MLVTIVQNKKRLRELPRSRKIYKLGVRQLAAHYAATTPLYWVRDLGML
jgi:hypothetical protein